MSFPRDYIPRDATEIKTFPEKHQFLTGDFFAIVTALFFGLSTPLAKHFLNAVQP